MRLLVAVDVNDRGEAVIDQVVPWARRLGGKVDLVFASEWSTEGLPAPTWTSDELDRIWAHWRQEADVERQKLNALCQRLPEDVRGEARMVAGHAVDVLPDAASGYDLLVLFSHARQGLERVLFGSVSGRTLRHAKVPVLVLGLGDPVPPPQGTLFVMAPTEESDGGALPWIGEHLRGAKVELVHVLPTGPGSPAWVLGRPRAPGVIPSRETVRALLVERAAAYGFPDVTVHVMDRDTTNPGDTIARVAHELGADLVVLPSHHRTGLDRVMLGSVAERVAERVPCPVIVVPYASVAPR